MTTYEAKLIVAPSKQNVPEALNSIIVDCSIAAIEERGVFTVALSGGSNVGFMASLHDAFDAKNVDPKFDAWHVILADERCVPSKDKDSNMGALQAEVFPKLSIPPSQIHGINEDELAVSSEAVATDYELIVREVLAKSGGKLDLAILGFGPDGHTCSLFPNHSLLSEQSKWVASLDDSPKPPPSRITLTYPVLNTKTRYVVFCGTSSSKTPILQAVFETVKKKDSDYEATMKDPPPFPCAAVRPQEGTVTWVVDTGAMKGISHI
jgi:6-phosphogluconolactonase